MENKKKLAVVTGGAGFIGRWVVSELLKRNFKAIAFDNFANSEIENIEEFKKFDDFRFIEGDIENKEQLTNLINLKPDYIFHLAARINVHESLEIPQEYFETNVVATQNIMEMVRKESPSSKIIIVGTCMVYDTANALIGISENHPTKPASPYAASKLAAEELALGYHFGNGLNVTVVRPFNTYGPFQKTNHEGGVVPIFISKILENEKIKIYGSGEQTRDLLYVEDCANFIVEAAVNEKSNGEIFNAGTGNDISVNDLAKLIAKDDSLIEHVPHHHPQSEIMKLQCDSTKSKEILNWEPKVSLEDGIDRLKNWLISQN